MTSTGPTSHPASPPVPPALAPRDESPPAPGTPPLGFGHAMQRAELARLFAGSARHYDRISQVMSLGFGTTYRREALRRAGIGAGMRVLDVGTGTGVLARQALPLVGVTGAVIAVDPNPAMLAEARARGLRDVREGGAEALPVADAEFDFVTMGYALRHVADLDVTFREFRRVLRPGGAVLILEQTPPDSRVARSLFRAYMRRLVPTMTRLVTRNRDARDLMAYYWETIENCVPPAKVLAALRRAGLVDVRRHVEKGAFSEYSARRGG